MKRIVALILIFTFALSLTAFFPVLTASAEDTSYLEVLQDGVYLYSDSISPEPQFMLPRTYYVELVKANIASGYHRVKYNGVSGLVKADEVASTTTANVQNPYYTSTYISANAGQFLYSSPNFSSTTPIHADDGNLLLYLGKIEGEQKNYKSKTWFAVLYSPGQVYYIHSQMTENIDLLETALPLHPNSAASTAATTDAGTDSDAAESADSSKGVDVVRILLIIGIFVPIVIILVVLFRPPKRRARSRDDRDADRDDY